jgi:hypothetical protein
MVSVTMVVSWDVLSWLIHTFGQEPRGVTSCPVAMIHDK